jgi:hypothetical protein
VPALIRAGLTGTVNTVKWTVPALCIAALLALVATGCGSGTHTDLSRQADRPATALARPTEPALPPAPDGLPLGGRQIFPAYRVVAYYGSTGGPALGVLGESSPDGIVPRLRQAAAPFATPGRRIQIAFELIVQVADRHPGRGGVYSHSISTATIRRYLGAARRAHALLVLDIQPGREDFLTAVKRYQWMLEQPDVGVALDAEWRMPPGAIPAKQVGRVSAGEVNRVSAWVAGIVRAKRLPEKLFLLHQFRLSMLPDIHDIQKRPGLAMVQHADGFGTRREKDATYRAIRRPQQFHLGYKLFYDEDVQRYTPAEVVRFPYPPEYISYQ